jgi:6,7-dimethyl-8-ribityllumazine synthase
VEAVSVARVIAGDRQPSLDLRQAHVAVADVDVAQQAPVAVGVLTGHGEPHALAGDHVIHLGGGPVVAALSALGGVDSDDPHALAVG